MKFIRNTAMLLLLVPAAAGVQADDGLIKSRSSDEIVNMDQVPEWVAETAREARPGSYVTRVTRKLKRDDEFYYQFDASQVGKFWVIVVRADGKLMDVYESPSPPASLRD